MTIPSPFRSLLSTVLSLTVFSVSARAENGGSFDHSHATLTSILREHVEGENFDYAALKKKPAPLERYLDTLAAEEKSDFANWTRKQQLAYFINLYNAATLKLVADHYPVKSIKDIGGIVGSPWKKKVVRLFGDEISLDHLEHDIMRAHYQEPRIHFAVNCASIGCPALPDEAFQASKLDAQLDKQGRRFLGNTSKNRLDAQNGILYLSPIFKWFKEDFVQEAGSVEKYVAPYFPEAKRQTIAGGNLKIRHTDYDWGLNT